MRRKFAYFIIIVILTITCINVIYYHFKKYAPAPEWYENQKGNISKLLSGGIEDVDNNMADLCKKELSIQDWEIIGPSIWRVDFYEWWPETVEFLIISSQPLEITWISNYLHLTEKATNGLSKDGYYRESGIGASTEGQREGYAVFSMIDEYCLYCKMYVPM